MSEYIIAHGIRIAKEFIPETFGRLTTIGPRFLLKSGNKVLRSRPNQVCQCACGSIVVVDASALRDGNTRSCGCLRRDLMTKHGMCNTLTYQSWEAMNSRCHNIKDCCYKDYGGRGIRVCDRWLEPETGFINFLADMGERPSKNHSIEREQVSLGYAPENCRWATSKEQARNRRNNVLITHNGKTQCLAAWVEETGISRHVIHTRLAKGLPTELVLEL